MQSMRWLSSLQDRDIELLELMEQHKQLQVTALTLHACFWPDPAALAVTCADRETQGTCCPLWRSIRDWRNLC